MDIGVDLFYDVDVFVVYGGWMVDWVGFVVWLEVGFVDVGDGYLDDGVGGLFDDGIGVFFDMDVVRCVYDDFMYGGVFFVCCF